MSDKPNPLAELLCREPPSIDEVMSDIGTVLNNRDQYDDTSKRLAWFALLVRDHYSNRDENHPITAIFNHRRTQTNSRPPTIAIDSPLASLILKLDLDKAVSYADTVKAVTELENIGDSAARKLISKYRAQLAPTVEAIRTWTTPPN